MDRLNKNNRPGYALLISMLLLLFSTGIIIFEFQYQKHQFFINREMNRKLEGQIKENLDKFSSLKKENNHNFQNK